MSDYTNTIASIRASIINEERQKIVDRNSAAKKVFETLRKQNDIPFNILLLCTVHGLILDYAYANFKGEEDITGCIIDPAILSSFDGLRLYEDIPGLILATSDEAGLVPDAEKLVDHFKALLTIFDEYLSHDKYLLSCLDSVKNSISIYDKAANLLFANKYFCNYLHIENRDAVIGMNIDQIISEVGTKIHSLETNTNHLKMYDVLEKGEDALDWEVRIETANGEAQLVGNDMYPVFNSQGKVEGMVEITHSRQQSLAQARKFAGLTAEYSFENIIGASPVIRASIRVAKDYSNSPFSLLVTGESGVGKELFAQSIHNYSARKKGPFVAINCASFPENLIESELFGYVGGAFTGAAKNGQIGKFELADGGTLFLDEIGELPYHFQSKLLRVLETWTITRIGSSKQIPVNVRLITATNRDLAQMVKEGMFRQDLYYRLQVLNINIPPLRERKDDILLISEELLRQAKDPNSETSKVLTEDAKRILLEHDWPGNVRELRNVLYRATLLTKTNTITKEVLASSISANGSAFTNYNGQSALDSTLNDEARLEQRRLEVDLSNQNLIKEALSITNGNKKKAAVLLDMSRTTFYRMLTKYNID